MSLRDPSSWTHVSKYTRALMPPAVSYVCPEVIKGRQTCENGVETRKQRLSLIRAS